jgi:hypothetical protein
MPEIFTAYDGHGGAIHLHKLEPHEIDGDKRFFIEVTGDPALTWQQLARLAEAAGHHDR